MCVLCWQFLAEDHWTDRQFDDADATATGTAGSERERARRRARLQRTRVLNRILSHYGLRLDDWHSRSYVLSDRKGKTVMVQHLGALWPAAQPLAGRRLDPLDPWLLEVLEHRGQASEPAS
jgi:hypothetical protein